MTTNNNKLPEQPNTFQAEHQNLSTKKRMKLVVPELAVGDPIGAQHTSWSFLGLLQTDFLEIHKPLDERLMWQDPYLSQWEGAKERETLATLEKRYEWSPTDNE